MTCFHTELGSINHTARGFGLSAKKQTLKIYEPLSSRADILIMGAIHGDESLSTVLLSECLRSLDQNELKAAVILAVNPDGVLAGTRCNAQGVDLNRNYPTVNWSPAPVYYRNSLDDPQNIALSPGERGGSEPETIAMMRLINTLKPKLIVSMHGFLACIDDPRNSAVGQDIARRTQMELVSDVGYATPGSFGSWCAEKQFPIITYELPSSGIVELREIHIPVLKDLMNGFYSHLL